MSDHDRIDWSKTSFEGSRRDQLKRWRAMTLRERLEALDQLTARSMHAYKSVASRSERVDVRMPLPVDPPACNGNEIVLHGCTPTPLASYLKALAILRLVAEQAGDPDATGCWRDDVFVLRTRLSEDELVRFFLEDYAPTPLVAPWNGGSGFYYQEGKLKEKDPVTGKRLKTGKRDQPTEATRALETLERSRTSRLAPYREVIRAARAAVQHFELAKAPEGELKDQFTAYIRNVTPDVGLRWLDAAFVLADRAPKYPPLLGTGGNDGNLDFTTNFMQSLAAVMSLGDSISPGPDVTRELLRAALFGQPTTFLSKQAIGQFSPGSAGGPNSITGFEGDPKVQARVNAWDFILMLEGCVLLAAAASRRLESNAAAVLSAPFTVWSRLGTVGSASSSDDFKKKEDKRPPSRGEIWMPLWSADFCLDEILTLFSEGRAVLGARPVRDGLDFARAAARLGVDRGIAAFQRFGLLKRSGDAHLATPLSRVVVRRNPQADLIDELEHREWLGRVQRYARDDSVPNAFRAAAARLDAALFALTQSSARSVVQEVLRQLGRIEALCATSAETRKAIGPVPELSPEWVRRADDGSPEFRIALALAGLSLRGEEGGKTRYLGMRTHLAPVALDGRSWDDNARLTCWGAGPIERKLAAVLHRRRLEAVRMNAEGEVLRSRTGTTLADVQCFLDRQTDDRRIAELLAGLACVALPEVVPSCSAERPAPLPAYALLKPFLTSEAMLRAVEVDGRQWLPPDRNLRLPADIPARLAGGDADSALRLAWQRLRALGVKLPGRQPPGATGFDGPRLLAALTIPLTFAETGRLLRWLDLAPEQEAPEEPLDETA